MKIHEFKEMEPMKYWSLPLKASDGQKKKLQEAVRGKNYYAVLKKDGAWYRFIKTNGELLLQSRTISKKTGQYVEKQDNVPHIIQELNQFPDGTVVVGEICFPDNSKISSDVVSIMGCLPAKAIERQKDNKIHYYIFDILAYNNFALNTLPAEKRMQMLQKLSKEYKFNYVSFAEPVFENLEEQIGIWLENGEEGAVLMHKSKPYSEGRSPAWDTIKFKQSLVDNLDLVIMGFTPPVTNYTGKYLQSWTYWKNLKTGEMVEGHYYGDGGYLPVSEYYFRGLIGGFELGAYYGDKLVSVGKVANLTDEIREDATKFPNKYLGTVVEVNAMSVDVERNSLRHAKLIKLRPDKNAKECLYNEIF
jgi:ATP-dependent DNA ligase